MNISSEISDILDIDEVEHAFKVKFKLVLSWYDSRLVYHNLKTSRVANSPAIKEVEKLWIPKIIFDNTEKNDVTAFDKLVKITIAREGSHVSADETVVDETNVFKGSENGINFERVYTNTFKCVYQLHLYPFDTQECTINLEVGNYERNIVMIFPKSIEMKS